MWLSIPTDMTASKKKKKTKNAFKMQKVLKAPK